jgi:hypothetical protein
MNGLVVVERGERELLRGEQLGVRLRHPHGCPGQAGRSGVHADRGQERLRRALGREQVTFRPDRVHTFRRRRHPKSVFASAGLR